VEVAGAEEGVFVGLEVDGFGSHVKLLLTGNGYHRGTETQRVHGGGRRELATDEHGWTQMRTTTTTETRRHEDTKGHEVVFGWRGRWQKVWAWGAFFSRW
jgi:hypothetical protein